jgi:hypothetical protein
MAVALRRSTPDRDDVNWAFADLPLVNTWVMRVTRQLLKPNEAVAQVVADNRLTGMEDRPLPRMGYPQTCNAGDAWEQQALAYENQWWESHGRHVK